MEKRDYTEIELSDFISEIYTEHPEYNYTKIANHLFLEHRIAISSQKVLVILEALNKHEEVKPISVDFEDSSSKSNILLRDYPFPLFTNIFKEPKDIEAAKQFHQFNVSDIDFSVRATHVLQLAKIDTISELLLFTSVQLLKFRNCGVTTIKEMIKECRNFIQHFDHRVIALDTVVFKSIEDLIPEEFTFETLTKLPIFSNTRIDRDNQNLHSSFYGNYKLKDIPFDVRTVNTFERLKLVSIKDLLFYPFAEILRTVASGKKTIENIQNKLIQFYKVIYSEEQKFNSFHDMLSNILDVKPDNLQIFFKRLSSFGKDATLESIGNRYNITRERVRQIVNKIEELFNFPFIEIQFEEFYEAVDLVLDQYINAVDVRKIIQDLSDLLKWNEVVSPEFLASFCSINGKYEINKDFYLIFSNSKKCFECNKLNEFIKLFFKSESEISDDELNSQLIKICHNSCKLYSESKQLDNQYIKWLMNENEELIEICIYEEEGHKYYSKSAWDEKNKPNSLIVLEILRQLDDPIHVSEFALIVNKQLGSHYSQYHVSILVQNTNQVYLWDRGTILAKSNFNFPTEFIENIIAALITLLETKKFPVVYINGFFEKIKEECNYHKIPNQIALYSLLRDANDPRLNLIRYPYIYLKSQNDGRRNITDEILVFLETNNRQYDYWKLREYFINTLGAADYVFQNAVASCDKLVKFGNNICLIDNIIKPEIVHEFAVIEKFEALDYVQLSVNAGIALKESEIEILKEMIKNNCSISFLKLDILTRRRRQDFAKSIFNINSLFHSKYNKELILRIANEEIWEINYYFNNPSNWQLDSDEPENIETSENNESKKDNYFESTDLNDDFDKLDHILDRTATSYKIYWFQALLYLIENDILEASFMEMAVLMCACAWQDVLIDKYEYPKIDKIPDIIKHIYVESDLSKSSTFEEVKDYLQINQNLYVDQLTNLTLYVPYRFLSVYAGDINKMQDFKKNDFIIKYANSSNTIYSFKEKTIIFSPIWQIMMKNKINNYQELITMKKGAFLLDV